jgi:hypothetical protein
MERALYLRDELLSTATEHKSACLGSRAIFEKVEALSSDLSLVERTTGTEMFRLNI